MFIIFIVIGVRSNCIFSFLPWTAPWDCILP